MGLASLDDLLPLLACPRCRSTLRLASANYRCTNKVCACSGEAGFAIVSGQPVLVDFQNSILRETEVVSTEATSVIARKTKSSFVKLALKKLLPANSVAAKNAAELMSLAKRQSKMPVLLIIGGGSAGTGTSALYEDISIKVIGFDIYATSLTQFVADAHQIPLENESVEAVWIQAVLEHVLDPSQVVSEIYRVLKHDGLVYAETPFLQQVHEGPYDFTRFTESGHRWLFKRFEAIRSGVVQGTGTQLLWSIEHAARGIFRSVRAGVAVKLALFWVQYLDRVIPDRYAVDAASAVFFLGRKSDCDIHPTEMVSYYQGAHARRSR